MARRVSDTVQLNSLANGVSYLYDATTGAGITIDTTGIFTLLNGTASYKFVGAAASNYIAYQPLTADGGLYTCVPVYFTSFPSSGGEVIIEVIDATDSTARASIAVTSAGELQLYAEAALVQVGSNSAPLSLNTPYVIELKTVDGGSPEVEARVNGVAFASGSGTLTLNGGVVYVGLPDAANVGTVMYVKDVKINDTTDTIQNSYPGLSRLKILRPNAAGDNTAWTGYVGSGANYERVDEVTPNDATDAVRSRVTDEIDDYNVESAGLSAADTINLVHVGTRANRSTGTTSSAAVARLKTQASGTVVEGAAETASSTTWRSSDMDTNNAVPYALTAYVSPQTGVAFTAAELETMQIGIRCSSGSGDRYFQLSTIWAIVDYTPGSAFIAGRPVIVKQAINRAGTY